MWAISAMLTLLLFFRSLRSERFPDQLLSGLHICVYMYIYVYVCMYIYQG